MPRNVKYCIRRPTHRKIVNMSKLTPLKNTELSEYCIGILAKHDIQLVVEFIKEKPEKLMKILNLNDVQIQKIKAELKRMYGPIKTNWSEKFQSMNESENPVEVKGNGQYYSTLIGPLDDLLAPSVITQTFSNNERYHMLGRSHLTSKIMWEICGPSGVGKTQLALTLVCNFIQLRQAEVLYIDTKLDFSTARLKQILTSRQLKTDIVAGIMQSIKVERVLSAQGVVEMLDSLYAELRNGSTFVRQIKMIVIDSLPAVWFLLKAEINRLAGKWLLSRLSQIIYRLCDEFSIAVICVNLSLIPSQSDIEEKHHQPFQKAGK